MIIEAGSFLRQSLNNRFQAEDFCFFFAERLADAKKIVRKKKIDVALVDLSGLKMEGLRILKSLKGQNASPEIITISNADQMALSIDGMKLGAFDDFLIPVDMQALMDRIRAAAADKKRGPAIQKRSLFQRYQDAMAAAAFAEAGEAKEAIAFLDHGTRRRKKQKGDDDGQTERSG